MNFLKRYLIMWHCAYILAEGCSMVAWRAKFGKASRRYVTKKLHAGGVNMLKSVQAVSHFSVSEKYKTLDHAIPKVFMSNHLSMFDLPLIVANINENIRMVIKKELLKVPFIGSAARASEQVIVDRTRGINQEAFYKTAKEKLASGISLWIFPEGTRSRTGELLPFKVGGIRLAKEIGAQIIPVGIVGTNKILPKGKLMPHLNQNVFLRVGDPINTNTYDLNSLLEIVRENIKSLITQKD